MMGLFRSFALIFDPYNVRGIGGLSIFCVSKIKTSLFLFFYIKYLFMFFSVLVRVVSGIPIACLFGMYIMILVLWYVKTKEHEEIKLEFMNFQIFH
jgi:hypothetical protein